MLAINPGMILSTKFVDILANILTIIPAWFLALILVLQIFLLILQPENQFYY